MSAFSRFPGLAARVIPCVFSGLLVVACSGEGPVKGTVRPSSGQMDDCTEVGKSRGPSEACCPTFGADACGANLFCGAFDGRTQPTCYLERSRAIGDTCTEDRQCVSESCNTEVGKCRGLAGGPCVFGVGCVPSQGQRFVCDQVTDTCVKAGGSVCEVSSDCKQPGACAEGHCTSGTDGQFCETTKQCRSSRCVTNLCSSGASGSVCASTDDCLAGTCVAGKCQPPRVNDNCSSDGDCSAGNPELTCHPRTNKCVLGRTGDSCTCDERGTCPGGRCACESVQCASDRCTVGRNMKGTCQ